MMSLEALSIVLQNFNEDDLYVNLGIEKFQTTRRDGHCL